MARALVLAACLVLGRAGTAMAGNKTSRVRIETDPPGAKVYFNLKEDGEICTTPCTVDAPIGETPIIIEAENRRAIIENLIVPRKTARTIKVSYKLEPAFGALVIEGGNGATIKIDEQDHGKAPRRLDDVLAGAHHLVLEKNGKKIYDNFVEIEIGHEATVSLPAIAAEPPRAEVVADPDAPAISARPAEPAAPAGRKAPSIAITAAVDAGFRQFTYKNNQTKPLQRDETEAGHLLAGPIIDVWPTTLLGLGVLPGLSVHGRFELGLNKQAVSIKPSDTTMPGTTSLLTSWRSLEVSLHQRWTIRNAATVEVGGGYTDDRYQFEGDPDDVAIVPDAVYKAVRIGGRASLRLDTLEPYLALENRLVLSGGVMDTRYKLGTSVNGVRGAIGATMQLWRFELRVEGSLTLYSWTFRPDNEGPGVPQADGGSDFIQNVTIALGYTYY